MKSDILAMLLEQLKMEQEYLRADTYRPKDIYIRIHLQEYCLNVISLLGQTINVMKEQERYQRIYETTREEDAKSEDTTTQEQEEE